MLYDVAIVGAGPAGATAAKFLSEQGLRTILVEKATFPRDKPCGGGLQLRILHRFRYIEENNLIDSYSSAILLHSSTMKHHINFEYEKPLEAMVRRSVFDQGLVNLAIRSGALLRTGTAAVSLRSEKEKISILLSDGTSIESRLVIGADGMWSTIAKTQGVTQGSTHIGVCAYNEYHLRPSTITRLYGDQRTVHIHLRPFGLAGYGWVFPKKEHINIGVAEFRQVINQTTEKKNLHTLYTQYLQLLKQQNLIPKNLPTNIIHGGVFPTCTVKRLSANRVLLCGDAGGLVNPLTGEGIYYAMSSGEIAAKIAIKAVEHDTMDAHALRHYQRRWNQEFRLNLSLLSRVSKYWGRNLDYVAKFVSNDKKLLDSICKAIPSPAGIHKEKWSLARRFLVAYCKDRLGMI